MKSLRNLMLLLVTASLLSSCYIQDSGRGRGHGHGYRKGHGPKHHHRPHHRW